MCVLLFNIGKNRYHCLIWGGIMGNWRTDRPVVWFHFNSSNQLSSECEQLTLISELRVVSLGFWSGGSNCTSYINRENLILRIVNLGLEKWKVKNEYLGIMEMMMQEAATKTLGWGNKRNKLDFLQLRGLEKGLCRAHMLISEEAVLAGWAGVTEG